MENIISLVLWTLIAVISIFEIIILPKQLKEPNLTKSQKKNLILRIILYAASLLIYIYLISTQIITMRNHKAQLEQTAQNAMQYIHNKYGFDADVVEIEAEKYKSAYSYDRMSAQMRYKDRDFYVYVDSKEKSDYGCDNYQYEEIMAAVLSEISYDMPEGQVMEMWIANSDVYSRYTNFLFEEYYDGSNLDEVIDNKFGLIEMIFADENIENKAVFSKLANWNIDFKFTSFDTAERLEEFKTIYQHTSSDFRLSGKTEYEIYAPYITNHIEMCNEKKSNINFSTKDLDGFKYCYFPTNVNKHTDSSDNVTVSEGSQSAIVSRFKLHDAADWVQKPISEAYRFDDLYGDVCIYYPLEKLNGYNISEIGAALYCEENFVNNWDIVRANICGEYAVFVLPYNDQSFMLVDTTGQGECIPEWRQNK